MLQSGMEGEPGGVGRKKNVFRGSRGWHRLARWISSIGIRNARIHERATSVMGGPPCLFFFFFFLLRTDRGVRGSSTRGRKHLVRRKKKKNDGGGGRSRG